MANSVPIIADYKPYIIGTNHLLYNAPATVRHIALLLSKQRGRFQTAMVEAYDPKKAQKTDVELVIGIDPATGEVECKGFGSNPHSFYAALVRCLRTNKIPFSTAYSDKDSFSIQLPDDCFDTPTMVREKLDQAGRDFCAKIDPIILERVNDKRPDLIVIGSAHADFLRARLASCEYIFVKDIVAGRQWLGEMKARIEQAIRHAQSKNV